MDADLRKPLPLLATTNQKEVAALRGPDPLARALTADAGVGKTESKFD
jgi:hypothetical protein